MFAFFSGDFSASYMLNFKIYSDYIGGTFGTLIAIPTKGTSIASPIENKNVLDLIEILRPEVDKFYQEDPGNITLNYYWLYNNEFQIFPTEESSDGTIVKLPKELLVLFEKE